MKSAYELAMERLEKESPTLALSEEAKAQIAEIESIAKARAAEKTLFLQQQIDKARTGGAFGEIAAIEQQLASELRRIEADAEEKKEKVRQGANG